MSPDTDPHDHAPRGDSRGRPVGGPAASSPTAHAGDDGSADPALLAALTAFRDGDGDQVAVVDALPRGAPADPAGRREGRRGRRRARPRPSTRRRSCRSSRSPRPTAAACCRCSRRSRRCSGGMPRPGRSRPTACARRSRPPADDTDLIVIDPGSRDRVRHPPPRGVGDRAGHQPWEPSFTSPEVFAALQESVGGELAVLDLGVEAGDPSARLRGPELVVRLELIQGLDQARARRGARPPREALGGRRPHRGARRLADGQARPRRLSRGRAIADSADRRRRA